MNKLRNLAQDSVETEFVFYVDIDFLMNSHLYRDINDVIKSGFFANEKVNLKGYQLTQLREEVNEVNLFLRHFKRALVVPAMWLKPGYAFPRNKGQVMQLVEFDKMRLYGWVHNIMSFTSS